MAIIPKTKSTNQVLFDTIRDLRKLSVSSGVGTWKAVAKVLAGSASHRAQTNLSKISKYTNGGEVVIVPGKVLGEGILSKKVTIVAFNASETAISKIEAAGGKFVTIKDYISKNPKDKPVILK
jgi:large subunit ribosomal protein L18e